MVESNRPTPHHSVIPQSLAKILVHTVFSTKDRRPFLRNKPLREELHRYPGGILTNSRMSFANCRGVTKLNSTNGMCGIDVQRFQG